MRLLSLPELAVRTHCAGCGAAKDRVVTIDEVVAREPDLIIGSWRGKKFRPEWVMARPGFDRLRLCSTKQTCAGRPGGGLVPSA